FRGDPRLKIASDLSARLKHRLRPLASVSPSCDISTGDSDPASKGTVIASAPLSPAFFRSRLFAVNRPCAAISSICHSLVAAGSSQPKILASHRILAVLIPFSFSWNQSWTVRRSTPIRFESICEIASVSSSGAHGPPRTRGSYSSEQFLEIAPVAWRRKKKLSVLNQRLMGGDFVSFR